MSFMKGDLLSRTRKLVKGLAKAEPVWLKAMEQLVSYSFYFALTFSELVFLFSILVFLCSICECPILVINNEASFAPIWHIFQWMLNSLFLNNILSTFTPRIMLLVMFIFPSLGLHFEFDAMFCHWLNFYFYNLSKQCFLMEKFV